MRYQIILDGESPSLDIGGTHTTGIVLQASPGFIDTSANITYHGSAAIDC